MGLIIILPTILICWFIGTKIFDKYDKCYSYDVSRQINIILGAIVICVLSVTLSISRFSFDIKVKDYYALKELIEEHRNKDFSEFERIKIYESIHETNKIINEHKVLSKNWFVNVWYSEEIGNLPYLK
jgi:hypothetical protein